MCQLLLDNNIPRHFVKRISGSVDHVLRGRARPVRRIDTFCLQLHGIMTNRGNGGKDFFGDLSVWFGFELMLARFWGLFLFLLLLFAGFLLWCMICGWAFLLGASSVPGGELLPLLH